jgi:hypothetical protein
VADCCEFDNKTLGFLKGRGFIDQLSGRSGTLILDSQPTMILELVERLDFEVLTGVNMFTVFFEVTPRSLVDRYQCSGGQCFLQGEGTY